MRRTLLWLVASVAFASLTSLADGAPLHVMSAPNLLRIGTAENIFVECQDCTGGNINVEIKVMNHPTKTRRLASTSVTLTSANNFQELAQITIPVGDFSRDPKVKQYVYLQAQFPGQLLEKVVLVSFQSGFIFIQTDKTLYTPNSRVHYRMFALTPGMQPVERGTQSDASIITEIMTPEGIILSQGTVSLNKGIHAGIYNLPELASHGVWKVVAKFSNNPQQNYSAEFEVKEYVLPSFEVKLRPEVPYFYVDSQTFKVNIEARYLFDEAVAGAAYVVFGVMEEDGKHSFPGSIQRVKIEGGNGVATLKREHIADTSEKILRLVGKSMFVSVSVLTESGSEMVEAELKTVKIVTSPYTIHFKKTPKFYKPGMSFDVAAEKGYSWLTHWLELHRLDRRPRPVEVLNPDDSPAPGVPVVINPGAVLGSTGENGLARLTINPQGVTGSLRINAQTNKPGLIPGRQATASMTALPYNSGNNNYIHIGVGTQEAAVGQNMQVNLIFNNRQQSDITYLILSRGQLIQKGRYKSRAEALISLTILIKKEMLPSFRIVAYYHTNNNEVVSDSVWVDVKDSCMGSLKLEPTRAVASYEPRKMFGLKVTGDPGATVGLVAVDKGVYVLNNKYRLTQKKVWDTVEKYDTGCTPGGGKNNMGVFFDAGLLFESNTASGTPYRQELKCPTPSRRKRATTIMEASTSLVSQYENQLQRECCLDGMRETPLSYNCERRSGYIGDGQACVDAFLHCCKAMEGLRAERQEEELRLARSDTVDSFNIDDIVTRTQFPESWLWKDVILDTCPPGTTNCDTKSKVKNVPLPDSITTWEFTGISLSRTHGICVGEPLEVIVRKDFFIDLRLPYSAVRGEQIEVKAILHNYSPDPITVRVDLLEQEHVCSSAFKKGRFHQIVNVGPQTTRSVPYVIMPVREGLHPIEVKAAVSGSSLNDGVRRMLQVVPQGVLVKSPQTITLDPAKLGAGGTQVRTLNNGIPRRDVAPNTPTSTQIYVTGREQVSSLVQNAISGQSMSTLIREPSGCGEQNLAAMTLPVIAATYLDKTKQWEAVGFEKRDEAIKHMQTGYTNQLGYRKADEGSFAVFRGSKSSTWLTAYVAKVFAMAKPFVNMQDSVICDAIKFLILKAQQPDGSFTEIGRVYSNAMRGDVQGADSDASMTAFCLIAMQESRTLCSGSVNSLTGSINKAVAYLERRLPHLTYSYAVAMASYALANENKLNRRILYKFASTDSSHWPVSKGHEYTLEATAYALLALVKTGAFADAKPVVRWFNKQQKVGGGYGSTQATIMVYQAVAQYWASAPEPDYNLNVDVSWSGRSSIDKFNLRKANQYATRTSKVNDIDQNVTVTATGTGEATVTLVALYYALLKPKADDCQKFNVTVEVIPVKLDEDENIYKLKIEVLFKDNHRDATMTILDIGLLTGFTVNTHDLDLLLKGRARTISKYEMNTVLSERGSLIIYLDKVSHTSPEEISFRIHQKMKAGLLQPAAVSVYEYYEPTPCVKFYHPEGRAREILGLCKNDVCRCAEVSCSMQKKGNIPNDERIAKACETTQTNLIDFVYKVRVEEFTQDLSIDIYKVRVLEAIKEGTQDVGPQGKLRSFLSYPHCRKSLDMQKGKTYLVMGSSKDIEFDDQDETIQYALGERTWVEYWPTVAECQTSEYRHTCLGMEDLVDTYTIYGCPAK